MDIKEIALLIDARLCADGLVATSGSYAIALAETLIESYKAELLKEVGEPVAYQSERNGFICKENKNPEYNIGLFTFDQLAAAILKAAGSLEEEIERLQDEDNLPVRYYQPNGKGPVYAVYGSSSIDFVEKLRNQLTVAQEELRSRDDFIAMLQETQKDQLAAAQEANEHWQRATAENENKWIEANDKLSKAEQLWQVAQGRCDGLEEKLAKAEQRVAEYNELIYAVQTKNPDETRHQTALRYIRNAENRPSNATANGASS